jgi:transcriptional regulator with XRE-family HTH domain
MANDYVELLRLGRRIQTERKILGFSQNGLAKDCGLNRSYFGGIERGERNLTFAILCKICNGLHCDICQRDEGNSADVLRSPPQRWLINQAIMVAD